MLLSLAFGVLGDALELFVELKRAITTNRGRVTAGIAHLSASGHKQTWPHVRLMSVIPLKADICRRGLHVRLVPEADIRFQPSSLPTSRSLDAFDQDQFPAA
jgi:hypothetical protein